MFNLHKNFKMEGELKQKQNYLRINTLERGCDAEQFMNFLQSKKVELGLDLNNCTLYELTLAMQEFNSLNNNNNLQNNNQVQQNPEEKNIENNNKDLIQMDIE